MRVRSHKNLPLRTLFVVLLCLTPFLFLGAFAARVGSLYHEAVAWSYDVPPPDPDSLWTADYDLMADMALYNDDRFARFHMPLNFTVDAYFQTDAREEIRRYGYSDNAALWTGSSMAAWVFKYVAGQRENNQTLVDDALRVIRNLTHGMAMMVAVPNGGLGPQFGAILARGWANPANREVADFFFRENSRHHNGTDGTALGGYDYSNWRYRAHTSNDEYGGYYMGIGLVLKYVNDPYCQGLVRAVVDQLADGMVHSDFLGIDAHGGPTGVDQKAKFFSGGGWALTLLKMAAIAHPEKYEDLYYRYATEEMYALMAREGGDQETVSNYYAYHFTHCVVFTLLLLEEEGTPLHALYSRYYLEGLRRYTATHRNPFFNVIYLATQKQPGDEPLVERDTEDQLMRFRINHFPDIANGTLPVPADEYQLVGVIDDLENFLEQDARGSLYRPFLPEIRFRNYYDKPLSVEYRRSDIFMWNNNPFIESRGSTNHRVEYAGMSYNAPYWIGRAFGYFPADGTREVA